MVTKSDSYDTKTDYQTLYDEYWVKDDRIGESSSDLEGTANQIIISCGIGRTLDIGSGEGRLVASLLRECVDAYGLDVSEVVVSRCNQRFPGRFTQGSVLNLPFADGSFQTIVSTDCMEHLASQDVPMALKEIYRVSCRYVFLQVATTQDRDAHWHLTVEGRSWWEARCFEAGFRKHPAYYRINAYESLNQENWQIVILLEKIPAEVLFKYPLVELKEERDLHMDMLRESGSRSDAHIGRYHFAARFIRPGDAVLDAACGLGYGTHVVRSETQARSFIGIDASEYAIDYARLNFGGEATSFCQGMLPDCLASIPDNSIDHVLCFETLEHVQDPVRLLAEFLRVLTPGGRLTCSVPHDWSDETGIDPNPFHFHVYDKTRFVRELSHYFDLERLMAQTADRVKQPGGTCVWLKRPRSLVDIAMDQDEVEAEWLLAVATKSPLNGHQVPYSEHVFSSDEQQEAGNALAFARDYSNPWLIRALVSIGLRTDNALLRGRWAEAVWSDPRSGAADRGAALCVLAYTALAGRRDTQGGALLDCIDGYLADVANDPNPTVLRWRVSLMYVGGLLALSGGWRETARRLFVGVIATPVAQYSPTLLTKPAEAAYLLGLLLAGDGRGAEACQTWWEAFRQISASIGERLVQGYDTKPPLFEIREISTVLSLCGRLLAAATQEPEQLQRPSIFYDECHADSLFKIQSFMTVEVALANLHRDFIDQQSGLNELKRGKEWLESQWKAQAIELDNRQQLINALVTENEHLKTNLELVQEKATRSKQSLFFRVVKKLGFFTDY